MKKFFFFIVIILISYSFYIPRSQKIYLGSKISNYIPNSIYQSLKFIFDFNRSVKKISNDYNEVFLPNTQNLKIDFKKVNLKFLKEAEGGYNEIKKSLRKTFFLEIFQRDLYILSNNGHIYFSNIRDILNKKNNFTEVKSNLNSNLEKKYTFEKILDFEINENKIYVSKVIRDKNCFYMLVDFAILNQQFLTFKNIFSTINIECVEESIQAGKIEILENKILLTTGADILKEKDESDSKPQDITSVYGKLLSINLENNSFEIFNKGHRNSLGLLVDQDLILSTENGPRGGDEINLEIKDKNYGWDIASYGSKYSKNELYFDHESNEYQEPIFSFVPSIGISEIIKLDDNFSDKWKDNFLIASLNDRHLLRVKFNKNRSKVLFIEKIFIGESIRDLAYDNSTKSVILALEETGSIGVFSNAIDN